MLSVILRGVGVTCMRRCVDRVSRCMSQHSQSISEPTQEYRTQRKPEYTLPFYGASDEEISQLSDNMAKRALSAYGGLVRDSDTAIQWRQRLRKLTNADYRPNQLTIEGVVVSNKMNKSVVVAARRRSYSSKLQKHYDKTRRFMAHDEFDLCREGDRVIIRSCRLLSKQKSHVVVKNFGDQTRAEPDNRQIVLSEED